jgi:N-acetylmuramoyl-L-alanine amidase
MELKEQFIPETLTKTRPQIPLTPKYITIHETDNTNAGADAQAHANLQSRGNSRQSSWHIQVDDKEAIQSIPFDEVAWAAGDGNGPGNRESVHIEICVNSDGDYKKAVHNAAEVTKQVRKQLSIPLDHVVQHNHWSGKHCPRHLRNGDKGIDWDGFISQLKDAPNSSNIPYPGHLIKRGEKGEDVKRIQRVVGVKIDGIFGPFTEMGVKNYQRAHKLSPDGIVGPKTWAVMF